MDKMSKVVSNKRQLRRLVELLQKNQGIARGVCSKPIAQRKWEEFAFELNSLGPPQREWHKWQRVWADLKCKIKKKKTENDYDENHPAGGQNNRIHHFSDLEEAVIEMLDFSTTSRRQPDQSISYDDSMMSTNESLISIEDIKFEPEQFNHEFVMKVDQTPPALPPKSNEKFNQSCRTAETFETATQTDINRRDTVSKNEENPAQKQFFECMTDLMRDIKRSINNIEDHLRRDVHQKEELLELKRQKLKLYKEKIKSQRVDRKLKLKLKAELVKLKRQKLSNAGT
ncbi:uncharacterized protein LOC129946375 [Eupeodes corollae]|uniref:uncharacterized protein LOC129946375 n=1 Tax=Eupeodes corollae TaxID=290404 RepID=UPI0024936B2E|nr:uncharacterized protein LOC129946375 [Eupeodes corollae]